jgi:hypothetical protein
MASKDDIIITGSHLDLEQVGLRLNQLEKAVLAFKKYIRMPKWI